MNKSTEKYFFLSIWLGQLKTAAPPLSSKAGQHTLKFLQIKWGHGCLLWKNINRVDCSKRLIYSSSFSTFASFQNTQETHYLNLRSVWATKTCLSRPEMCWNDTSASEVFATQAIASNMSHWFQLSVPIEKAQVWLPTVINQDQGNTNRITETCWPATLSNQLSKAQVPAKGPVSKNKVASSWGMAAELGLWLLPTSVVKKKSGGWGGTYLATFMKSSVRRRGNSLLLRVAPALDSDIFSLSEFAFSSCNKIADQKQLGVGGFQLKVYSLSWRKVTMDSAWMQELKQRVQRKLLAGLPLLAVSASFSALPGTTCLRVAP